jgi:ribulose-5-phosphate 4-epimerase/fuculose-1-phosphate aldolase
MIDTQKTSSEGSLYDVHQDGLIFPKRPTFETLEDERLHRKKRLVAACRAFARYGFGFGFGGHLTVRDPIMTDHYWTNPMAIPFSQVCLSSLVLANHQGHVVEGRYGINKAGYVFHAAVHRQCPDIIAMCHAHTQNCGA